MRIDQLLKAFDLEVKWTAFPLHPEIPEEGMSLADLFKGRPINIEDVRKRLTEAAAQFGLPLSERTMTYNTRLAHEMAKWAESEGKGDRVHRAIFTAYFAEGRNIGLIDELVPIAESAGLSPDAALKVLTSRAFSQTVDDDWARSRTMHISAVPTFVMAHGRVTGAQPYDVLEKFVRSASE